MSDFHTGRSRKASRSKERRGRIRTLISTPVRVRSLEGASEPFDETTTTVNLSATGILIETTNHAYHSSMKVRVTVPYDKSGPPHPEKEGRVVRVTDLGGRHRTVAIALEQVADAAKVEKRADTPAKIQPAAAVPLLSGSIVEPQDPSVRLILVVESDTAISSFMKTYLSSEGYEVIILGTVSEARSVLDQRTPSLVIAEVEGEHMPGYTICSHCKETPRLRPVPVMLLTSSAYPSDYAKAHSLGAVVCMAKPFKRERFGHVVRLLAPPAQASTVVLPRVAPQNSPKPPKTSSGVAARRFRLPPLFGR